MFPSPGGTLSLVPQAGPFRPPRTGSGTGRRGEQPGRRRIGTRAEFGEKCEEPVEFAVTMPTPDLIAIIGSIFGSALALGVMMMRLAARIDADRRAFQAEAAQDRRALQASMDRFQAEMQRFAERQSRVEAAQEVRRLNPGAAG